MIGGTPAAGSTIWAMRNVGTKTVRLRNIDLMVGFSGTAAATAQSYQIVRFSGATPTGGTALVVVKRRNSASATTITDARFGGVTQTALTVAGVAFEAVASHVGCSRQNGPGSHFDQIWPNTQDGFEIAVNEGLAIQIELIAVAGDWISGTVTWDEF